MLWVSCSSVKVWNSCSLDVASLSAAGSIKAALHLGRKKLFSLSISAFSLKVVEDGYEFFAKRQLVTLFSAPNYCGEFDNAGAMMSVDETLMCSFQVWYLKVFYWLVQLHFKFVLVASLLQTRAACFKWIFTNT